ncbi:putative class I SAM-dependent methyltransferase [Paratrimastix pyriformis]|uniref:Class I SAM-dependent methyltransferase n=1 Tax=Paratrimastix pyriformis TaxID=342808 RepID=A0ABQ8UBT9_9EUKA|nr:putative class I SAM-dependent methyltransferase [Paratrimastix pyriformis]
MFSRVLSNLQKLQRTCCGQVFMRMMNLCHEKHSRWVFSHLPSAMIQEPRVALDVGCGGGHNIAHLLTMFPKARVFGADYSEASIERSGQYNRAAVKSGRLDLRVADVAHLPYADGTFNLVTAFDTIYFWPSGSFREIARVAASGATFVIGNELSRPKDGGSLARVVPMTIYTVEELREQLEEAGFCDVVTRRNGRWICVMARKP